MTQGAERAWRRASEAGGGEPPQAARSHWGGRADTPVLPTRRGGVPTPTHRGAAMGRGMTLHRGTGRGQAPLCPWAGGLASQPEAPQEAWVWSPHWVPRLHPAAAPAPAAGPAGGLVPAHGAAPSRRATPARRL